MEERRPDWSTEKKEGRIHKTSIMTVTYIIYFCIYFCNRSKKKKLLNIRTTSIIMHGIIVTVIQHFILFHILRALRLKTFRMTMSRTKQKKNEKNSEVDMDMISARDIA